MFGFSHHHRTVKRVWITVERLLPQALRTEVFQEIQIEYAEFDERRASDGSREEKNKTLTHKNRPNACNRFALIFFFQIQMTEVTKQLVGHC